MENLESEVWKDIVGYEGWYQVSNCGRIRSLDRVNTNNRKVFGKLFNLKSNYNNGYVKATLSRGKDRKQINVHEIVVNTFIGNDDNFIIQHIDGNKANNNINNLKLVNIMNKIKDDEIWKQIKGYENIYDISNYGRVRTYHKGNGEISEKVVTILKGKVDKDGYIEYSLNNNGVTKFMRGHRLVALNFIDNPNNYPQVNHIDGVKDNNHIDNLELCDARYNANHKYENGLGEKSREVASLTHGKNCSLIELKTGKNYNFNSYLKAEEFIGVNYRGYLGRLVRENRTSDLELKFGYKLVLEG